MLMMVIQFQFLQECAILGLWGLSVKSVKNMGTSGH